MRAYRLAAALLLISVPAVVSGCASDPEPAEESAAVVEPEVAEDPVEVEEPESGMEEAPELVWSNEYDNHVESVTTRGDKVAVGEEHQAHIQNLSDGSPIDVLTFEHVAEDLEFSLDEATLGVGLGVGGVVLTELSDGSEVETLGTGYNSRLAFSPDGVHIATGNRDGVAWIWELDGPTEIATLDDPDNDEWLIARDYNPSGELLAATHQDGTVNIWDVETQEVVQTLQSSADVLAKSSFRFSPDGTQMAYAAEDGGEQVVRFNTVEDNEEIGSIAVPPRLSDLAFSPDGTLLAVASREATTIWDVDSGELIYELDQQITAPDNSPSSVVFTSDGTHLVVGSWTAGTVELWQLPDLD